MPTITNKPQTTGIIILFTGVALLAFTFINAFLFLQEPLSIIATQDLSRVFGESLAPLIQACIRLMYLGIMGWVGSLLTVRGIPLVTHKHVPVVAPLAVIQPRAQPQPVKQPKPTQQPPKPQLKPSTQPTAKPTSQQPKPEPQSQPPTPPEQAPHSTLEPKAILIPPENQREE